jgi:hypothetical protein
MAWLKIGLVWNLGFKDPDFLGIIHPSVICSRMVHISANRKRRGK